MTLALKLLIRVVKRRVAAGEDIDTVLADYPKLTETEKWQVRKEVWPDE